MKILSLLPLAALCFATLLPAPGARAADALGPNALGPDALGPDAASPVNPHASPEVCAVLGYLHQQSGHKILAAQHGDTKEYEYVHDTTGKYAAIWGTDLILERRNDKRIQDIIGWWQRGVIPTVMWHWGAPSKGEGYEQAKMQIDIDQCFLPGTPEHAAMWADLKRIADHLTVLRDAHVPILWRPMHECSGGWFWWDKDGGDHFQRLWRTMFDYFTRTRKLDNLIWVLGYDGSPNKAFDPGPQFYDIVGADNYDDRTDSHLSMFQAARAVSTPGKLVTFHECALPPDPELAIKDGAAWCWFMNWDQHVYRVDKAYLTKVYNSEYTLTLDELPRWSDLIAAQQKTAPLAAKPTLK